MKDKIMFGLFVLLAFSAGFTLGGVGKSDTDIPQITANASSSENALSSEQVLVSVNKVLEPFIADYQKRYDALNAERVQLQAELGTARQELATVQVSGDTVSVLKSQVSTQQSEIGNLSASLQNAVNDSASWQQKFQQTQLTVSETQKLLMASQDEYGKLSSKLQVVNGRTSDTVNGFTAEEKATFYKVWDEWWELVVVGTD